MYHEFSSTLYITHSCKFMNTMYSRNFISYNLNIKLLLCFYGIIQTEMDRGQNDQTSAVVRLDHIAAITLLRQRCFVPGDCNGA